MAKAHIVTRATLLLGCQQYLIDWTDREVYRVIEELQMAAVLSTTTLCVQIRQACSAGASPAGKGTRFP